MVIWNKDIVRIQDITLIININSIVYKENPLTLDHCTTSQASCEADDGIYIWNHKSPICDLKSNKIITGEVIHFKKFKYFISNHSLLHLQLGQKERICDMKVYQTTFKGLIVLGTQTEKINGWRSC